MIFFYTAVFAILLSLYFFATEKNKKALYFLVLGAILLGVFAALLDPFLNLWDERFHALVAKNLLNHPLKPTLYDDPVVPMEYDRWDRFTIWLHKQPLFLWQIALFFRIFGINEFVLRIPNIIQNTLLVLIIYRIGKNVINQRTGYIAAFLFLTSHYMLELVSGRQSVDSNDVAFLFYITCSIWAFTEYLIRGDRRWVIFIGLFAGCAVLCKWMVGTLVFFIWAIYLLLSHPKERRKYFDLVFAAIIALIIILPWQLLILHWYPAEAIIEYKYNSIHFSRVVEGHDGNAWFYYESAKILYAVLIPYFFIAGVFLMRKKMQDRILFYTLFVIAPVFIYVFFTLAKTKMISYPFIISPLIFLGAASLFDSAITNLHRTKIIKPLKIIIILVLMMIMGQLNLNYRAIRNDHDLNSIYSRPLIENRKLFKTLKSGLPANSVIFNVTGRHYIECMFYTGFPSYNFIPSEEQFESVEKANRTVAVITDGTVVLPDYLLRNKDVILLKNIVGGNE